MGSREDVNTIDFPPQSKLVPLGSMRPSRMLDENGNRRWGKVVRWDASRANPLYGLTQLLLLSDGTVVTPQDTLIPRQDGEYNGKHVSGYLGFRTEVCFYFDTSKIILGTIVRDDFDEPHLGIIRLDDGRYIKMVECAYSPLEPGTMAARAQRNAQRTADDPKIAVVVL